jgi:hypothetical protein
MYQSQSLSIMSQSESTINSIESSMTQLSIKPVETTDETKNTPDESNKTPDESNKTPIKPKKSYKPKVYYNFTKKSAKDTLREIKSRTDDLKSIGAPVMITNGVSESVDRNEYINDLLYEINKSKTVYYGTLNAPEDASINKKIIGKGGCYFYKTTYDNNIFFIWHNKDTKLYEFWGADYYGMINSMNAISHRINKCSQ